MEVFVSGDRVKVGSSWGRFVKYDDKHPQSYCYVQVCASQPWGNCCKIENVVKGWV